MDRHSNNFDFLRLIFALFVIITHSYHLLVLPQQDFLSNITKGQLSFSHLGVCGFFTISGYLIFKSLIRSKNATQFLKKRILRLFPGLSVVLVFSIILGAFVTRLSFASYFTSLRTYLYLPANLSLYRLQDFLPGVFEKLPFKNAINGSLWTLPYEFACYLTILLLLPFKTKPHIVKLLVVGAFFLFFFSKLFLVNIISKFDFVLSGKYILEFGGYFVSGSVLAMLQINNFKYKGPLAFFALVLSILFLHFFIFDYFSFITLPVTIIAFGLLKTPYISSISKHIGDLSYGIYIYAFPVQQTLIYFGITNHFQLMINAAIISSV